MVPCGCGGLASAGILHTLHPLPPAAQPQGPGFCILIITWLTSHNLSDDVMACHENSQPGQVMVARWLLAPSYCPLTVFPGPAFFAFRLSPFALRSGSGSHSLCASFRRRSRRFFLLLYIAPPGPPSACFHRPKAGFPLPNLPNVHPIAPARHHTPRLRSVDSYGHQRSLSGLGSLVRQELGCSGDKEISIPLFPLLNPANRPQPVAWMLNVRWSCQRTPFRACRSAAGYCFQTIPIFSSNDDALCLAHSVSVSISPVSPSPSTTALDIHFPSPPPCLGPSSPAYDLPLRNQTLPAVKQSTSTVRFGVTGPLRRGSSSHISLPRSARAILLPKTQAGLTNRKRSFRLVATSGETGSSLASRARA